MATILDGGLATTLQDAGYDVEGHPLWSAHLLKTEPQAIVDAHSKFIEAGAEIVTTASYQVIGMELSFWLMSMSYFWLCSIRDLRLFFMKVVCRETSLRLN